MKSGIYLILNHNLESDDLFLLELAKIAKQQKIAALQLRSKEISDHRRLDFAYKVRQVLKETPFIINDRADIALLSKADGIHVGLDDLSPAEARILLPRPCIIGASSHNSWEAREQSSGEYLDYLAFGPTFDSSTKIGHASSTGLKNLRELCANSKLPVCAIGGLNTPQDFYQVARAGATYAATISAVEKAEKPEQFLKEIIQAFDQGQNF